jgi:hypothetical protein
MRNDETRRVTSRGFRLLLFGTSAVSARVQASSDRVTVGTRARGTQSSTPFRTRSSEDRGHAGPRQLRSACSAVSRPTRSARTFASLSAIAGEKATRLRGAVRGAETDSRGSALSQATQCNRSTSRDRVARAHPVGRSRNWIRLRRAGRVQTLDPDADQFLRV